MSDERTADKEGHALTDIKMRNEYLIDTAPRNGTEIEVLADGEWQPVMWSNRPVCMLGSTFYWPPGWVTSPACETDLNLPLDISPTHWRPPQ